MWRVLLVITWFFTVTVTWAVTVNSSYNTFILVNTCTEIIAYIN